MLEDTIHAGAEATLTWLMAKDPGLKELMDKMYGYAVFPAVGRAGLVLGGARGHGEVFEHGKPIGFATLSQLTIGVQVGGQTFSELVMFTNKDALETFKKGKVSFTANASAVVVKAGATGTSDPRTTIAKAYSRGGLLLEASLGGQKFSFKEHLAGERKGIAKLLKRHAESGEAARDEEPHEEPEPVEARAEGADEEPEERDEGAEAATAEEGEAAEDVEGRGGEDRGEEPEELEAANADEAEEQTEAGSEEEPEARSASEEDEPERLEAASADEGEAEEPLDEPEPPPKPAKAAPTTHKKSGPTTRGTQPRGRA